MSTENNVWQTLSAIDVTSHIEKKGKLSYLSWAWAWGVLMEHYPDSDYQILSPVKHEDESVTVWVSLTVDGKERKMWLPVMDYKNEAIKNPDARKISDATMRCLVKAIAMFGLGHYIYAGEDLPETVKKEIAEKEASRDLEAEISACKNSDDMGNFWNSITKEQQNTVVEPFKAKMAELGIEPKKKEAA